MSAVSSHNEQSVFYRHDNDPRRNNKGTNSSTNHTSTSTIIMEGKMIQGIKNNKLPSSNSLDNDKNNDINNNNIESKPSENNESMTIEERQIHDSILREREKAHAKLQATLDHVRETTRAMLNEIDVFLESTENVMVDYTKCQNSQRNEARRLEEVEPDVAGATERYLQQMQGMMQ